MPYTEEQKAKKLEVFHDLKSYTKAVRKLGHAKGTSRSMGEKRWASPKRTEANDRHKHAKAPITGTNEC